ncbi:G2/mitotic-specific cyclin-2 isoform X2 [Lolium perenne]|uniref:G2/mitotic-specific cyclin-2 isoform X2 n=1 Tax=Lolium perenne TaxID=4522 RepID=UPI0021F57EF9|nr:cyclin-B1-3-like isoform X2 [Lolium perenne]
MCIAPMDIDIPLVNRSDLHDLLKDTEYSQDIYDVLSTDETNLSYLGAPYKCLLNDQDEENVQAARARVIRWILDSKTGNGLCCILPETVFLAVNIIDRFLAVQNVPLNELHLVGAAALLLAAKYEEGFAWNIKQYVFNTSKCRKEKIVAAEKLVWDTLEGQLKVPTSYQFLMLILNTCSISCSAEESRRLERNTLSLAKTALLHYTFVGAVPSQIACSCIYIARQKTGLIPWDQTLMKFTGYHQTQLVFCIDKLQRLIQSPTRPRTPPPLPPTATRIPGPHHPHSDFGTHPLPHPQCTGFDNRSTQSDLPTRPHYGRPSLAPTVCPWNKLEMPGATLPPQPPQPNDQLHHCHSFEVRKPPIERRVNNTNTWLCCLPLMLLFMLYGLRTTVCVLIVCAWWFG